MLTNAPRGTKDILPGQIHKWNHVEQTFKDICTKYAFKEIRTPTFEHTELFKRGVGDTTDIVEKQMYSFDDYGGRNLTLKPEGTAPVVRAFVENKLYADLQPSKYFYVIPCFRYEKPQTGRLREFHQFGIEVFGTDSMLADAEVISLAVDFFEKLGVKDLELRINSIGCPKCREEYRIALRSFLADKYDQLCDTCKGRYERNPMRILDCKSETCQSLVAGAPRMLDYICDECRVAFEDLKRNLTSMDIDFTIDPGIVRGLDYYTKTAFEIVSKAIGAQGTVCGGGRYDNLIEQIGGPATPGVGFGLGIERLLLVMESSGATMPDEPAMDVFVAVIGDEARDYGVKLIREMRRNGIVAQMDLMSRNIKNQFKYADRLNASRTLVIGENELKVRRFHIKNMRTSEQIEIDDKDIIPTLIEMKQEEK